MRKGLALSGEEFPLQRCQGTGDEGWAVHRRTV